MSMGKRLRLPQLVSDGERRRGGEEERKILRRGLQGRGWSQSSSATRWSENLRSYGARLMIVTVSDSY
eukprot:581669-Hanusia_phi.AAC.1